MEKQKKYSKLKYIIKYQKNFQKNEGIRKRELKDGSETASSVKKTEVWQVY